MDIEKLIERLKERDGLWCSIPTGERLISDAATALSTLQAENKAMQKQLNEFSEFLCRMTGGLLSKTNYTAQVMATIAEDYQQKACRECNLQAENEKLRAELKNKVELVFQQAKELDRRNLFLQEQEAELELVTQERDAAIEAANGLDKMIGRAWGED